MKNLLIACLTFGAIVAAKSQNVVTIVSSGGSTSVSSNNQQPDKKIANGAMEFTYNYTYLTDTTDRSKTIDDLMILQTGEGISKFYSYRRMQADSLMKVLSAQEIMADPKRVSGGETFMVYKNYPKGKVSLIDRVALDIFLCEERPAEFDWQLGDESKEILGYLCRRAECNFGGRRWVAWYTELIPVSDGPYKFAGLPGLIMEIGDNQGHHTFTMAGINPSIAREVTYPQAQTIKTTSQKYFESKRKLMNDPAAYLSNSTGGNVKIEFKDTPNSAQDATQPPKKQYDFLERQ